MNDFGNSDGPDRVGSPEGDSMACPFDRGLLTAYFDGEATPAEREEVDRHLASCADCRRELLDLRSAVTRVKSLPRVKAPPGLAMHVSAAISSAPRAGGSGHVRWFQAAAGIAAGLLVAASVFILVKRPPVEDRSSVAASSPSVSPEARSRVARSMAPEGVPEPATKGPSMSEGMEATGRPDFSPPPIPPAADLHKDFEEAKGAESRLKTESKEDEAFRVKGLKQQPVVPFSEGGPSPASAPKPSDPAAKPIAKEKGEAVDEPRILQVTGKPAPQAVASLTKILQKSKRAAVPSDQFGASAYAKSHYLEVELTDVELEELTKALRDSGLAVAPGSMEAERQRVAPYDPETLSPDRSGKKFEGAPAPARSPDEGKARAMEETAAKRETPVRRRVILAFVDPDPTK